MCRQDMAAFVRTLRHRARANAEALLAALAYAVGLELRPVEDLDTRVPVLSAMMGPAS